MPSAILDSNCKSRFVTLYILLICGDINPNPGPQWRFPCGFRSAVNKIDQFHAMVDSVKPDIIVGTESWLRPDIINSEIFPSNYKVYRRDRDTVTAVYLQQLLTKYCQHANSIWKHHVKWLGQRSAQLAAKTYMSVHTTDRKPTIETAWTSCLVHLIGFVIPRTATFGLLVILNSLVLTSKTLKHNCPSSDLRELFVKSLDDQGLTQMVDKPTRHQQYT